MTDPSHLAHLHGLEAHLRSRIRGQDHVTPRIASGFCRAALSLADARRPAVSNLLVGPTGTGKSLSFELAADYTFGPGRIAIFDMTEYQDRSAAGRFIGENRDDPGLLGRALAAMKSGALLFDEIEKAHPLILDLFLQILWRGCITVATGQTFPMGGYVIGFTSNIGATDAMRMAKSTFASVEQATLRRVSQSLRPELVGRIDEQLVFRRLDPEMQEEICAIEVGAEIARLRQQGYDLAVTREALEYLMREGFHPELGARPLRKTVGRELQGAVMQALFSRGSASGTVVPDSTKPGLRIQS